MVQLEYIPKVSNHERGAGIEIEIDGREGGATRPMLDVVAPMLLELLVERNRWECDEGRGSEGEGC